MKATDAAPLQPTVFGAMRRYPALVAISLLLCAGLGVLFTLTQPALAKASASLVVQDPRVNNLFGSNSSSASYVADQVQIMKLPVVAEAAAKAVRTARPESTITGQDVVHNIDIRSTQDNSLIKIMYADASPAVAQATVNAVVDAYGQMLNQAAARTSQATLARIDDAVAALDAQIAKTPRDPNAALVQARAQLLDRRSQVLVDNNASSAGIVAFSPAVRPVAVRPNPFRYGLLGLLVGLLPASALSFLVASRRRRFVDRFEPELVLETQLMSEVPEFSVEHLRSDLPAFDATESAAAESFRFAAAALGVRQAQTKSVVSAVVSASSSDGKTTVCANLALTAAREGRRVLAIDCDLEGQGLSYLLLGEDRPGAGVGDVLAGGVPLGEAVSTVSLSSEGRLDVLPAGRHDRASAELFASAALRPLMRRARVDYDLILLDVPPLLQVAYSNALVTASDSVIVVVPHRSPARRLEEFEERLRFLGVASVGYVYNRAPLRQQLGVHSRLVTRDSSPPRQSLPTLEQSAPEPAAAEPSAPESVPESPTNVRPVYRGSEQSNLPV